MGWPHSGPSIRERAGTEANFRIDRRSRGEAAGSRHVEGLSLIVDANQHEPWQVMAAVETVRGRMIRTVEEAVERTADGL